jgi:translation initiation factor IF-3
MASKVDTSSFQKIAVSSACPIKKLLESNKLKFEKGKAFYEMTKSETIQVNIFES